MQATVRDRGLARARLGMRAERLGWATLALAGSLVLLASCLLTPAASGVGTHTQLGLPPCGFLSLFQRPCPACGLTTSFAHLAHGSLHASLIAHPLGPPLFAALLVLVPRSLFETLRVQPTPLFQIGPREVRVAWVYTAALLLVWLVRLLGRL
jgi:hypothetical protein